MSHQRQGKKLRARLKTLYGDRCPLCGCTMEFDFIEMDSSTATIDHVVPMSKGGKNSFYNIQLMCHKCNQKKAAKRSDYYDNI